MAGPASERTAAGQFYSGLALTIRDGALVGAFVSLLTAMGLLLPGADPWDGDHTVLSVLGGLPWQVPQGAVVGAVLAVPVALLASYTGLASWRGAPLALAMLVAATSVWFVALALGGMVFPFERVMVLSPLPTLIGLATLVVVLMRAPSLLPRLRPPAAQDRAD